MACAVVGDEPLGILTDLDTVVRNDRGIQIFRVDPTDFLPWVRSAQLSGSAFDYKAALICSFVVTGQEIGDFLVCDSDSLIQHDPRDECSGVGSGVVAMPPDPGARMIVCPSQHYPDRPTYIEHSSCVLYFPRERKARVAFAAAYNFAWRDLEAEPTEQRGLACTLREQRGWSVAWARMQGHLFPREFGWSPRCWGENAAAAIIHLHGAQKWEWKPETLSR